MVGFTLKCNDIQSREKDSPRGNCLDLCNGGLVRSGECALHDESENLLVGQILSLEDRRDIAEEELQLCMQSTGVERERLALLRHLECGNANGKFDPTKYNQVPIAIEEVQLTNQVSWVPTDSIKSIAFVFHIDAIQGGKCECGGISNAFALRNRQAESSAITEGSECATTIDGERQVVLTGVDEKDFLPFKVPYNEDMESYSNRIWNGIAAAKELCFRALSCKGVWDGRNKHVHMIGSNYELFHYLQSNIIQQATESPPIQKRYHYKRAKKRMNADLSVSNKRLKTRVDLVRIVEEPHLDMARRVLGSAFAVAITKAVPTMKQIKDQAISDTVYLRETDMVRTVTCRGDDVDIDSNKECTPCPVFSSVQGPSFDAEKQESIDRLKRAQRCPFPGLELECQRSEMGVTDLHIHIMFKKLLGKSTTVRKAQRGGHLTRAAAKNNTYSCAIGDELMWDEKVYSIVTVKDGKVGCALSGKESLGATIEVDAKQAELLIDNFLES